MATTTANYVGPWRPHRPRGPIGAHFKSPGPKYMLPGSTGFATHDMRKKRGPAFSFGTRHATFTNDHSPGPGGYLVPPRITRCGNDGTPRYSLYGRPRDMTAFKTPGPGTYSPEKSGRSAHYSAPIYSLSRRMKGMKSDNSPGPASYNLPPMLGAKIVSKTSAPGYSMTGRVTVGSFHEDLRKTPGPGTYRVIEPYMYKNRAPLYSMTGRNMLPSDTTQKPGPGAHSPEKTVHGSTMNMLGEAKVHQSVLPRYISKLRKYIPHIRYMPQAEQVFTTRHSAPQYSFGILHSEYLAPLIADPEH